MLSAVLPWVSFSPIVSRAFLMECPVTSLIFCTTEESL